MSGSDDIGAAGLPLQDRIQQVMQTYREEDRWESIYLFSAEGFLMARDGVSASYNEDALLEFSLTLVSAVELLGDNMPVKEIIIRGKERKRLVFRYFEAWGSNLVLAAVITGRKGYIRAMDRLIKHIANQQ